MYRIYCDETWTSPSEYVNVKTPYIVFYGVMVDDSVEGDVLERIKAFKESRGLFPPGKELPAEIKMAKVEEEWKDSRKKNIANRHEDFLDIFFENLRTSRLSFGYMFVNKKKYDEVGQSFLERQNDNRHNFFFMMYFQFLYHCFIKPQVKQQNCEIVIDNHDMGADGQQYDIDKLKEILNRKLYRDIVPKNQLPLSDDVKKKLVESVNLVSLVESKESSLIQMSDLSAGCIRYALEKELNPPSPKNQLSLFGDALSQEPISGKENLAYHFYRRLREIKGYSDINLLKISYHHRFNIFPFTF